MPGLKRHCMQDDAFDHEPDTAIAAPAQLDPALVNRIIEAALLASAQPMAVAQLAALLPEGHPDAEASVGAALEQLVQACEGRGVELVEVASGWRYQVKAEVHGWISRMWTERKTRYTRATLETLALIAYRQPITRGEIEQVRGVAVSSNIIQALEEREWIRVVGHRDVPGRPALFGTTRTFLDYFGLKRLDELPPLSELKEISELDPQLPFAPAPPAARAAAEGQPAQAGAEPAPAGIAESGVRAATGQDGTDAGSAPASDDETAPAADLPDTGDHQPTPNHDDVPAPANAIDNATPAADQGDDADDTRISRQPQEDDAEPVSSEHKS
jgi:segregation and condensation protein B